MGNIFLTEEIPLPFDSNAFLVKITINRPDARNAVNTDFISQLDEIITNLEDRHEIRVIILTGSGSAFCAGADLKQLASFTLDNKHDYTASAQVLINKIANFSKPTIAALNGHAFGGGFELALACDFRIGKTGIMAGLTENRLGLVPAWNGTLRLSQILGVPKAKELIFTGKRMSSAQLHMYGILNYVVDEADFEERVLDFAFDIAKSAPLAVASAKFLFTNLNVVNLEEFNKLELARADYLAKSDDYKEGIAAFREKRTPIYKGS